MIDERQEMPDIVIHLIWMAFGLGGLFLTINESNDVGYSDSLYLLACIIFSGFASYGVLNFIGDLKKGKSWRGVIREIKNNIKRITD